MTAAPDLASTGNLSVAFLVQRFPVLSESFVATSAAMIAPRIANLSILATNGKAEPPPYHPIVTDADLLSKLQVAQTSGKLGLGRVLALAREQSAKAPFLAALLLYDRLRPSRTAVSRMMARQPPFDIVHCQFGYEGLVAHRHRRLGTLRTRALICHFRGSDLTRYVRKNGRGVYRRLFGDAELLIANCDYFRRRLLDLGAPADRTVVIGSPIDTGFFAPPEKPRETYDGRRALRLVAVGRLAEKKGFADAIDAVAKLEDRDATLEIYGDGPLRAQLEARAQDHGLANRVTFHGPAVAREILAGLHRADIALAPSVTAQDGDADAPVNTLKEAMATGLPVIATRHGGIPELVEHGVNGLLVPERDPAAIAAALRELAAAPERWHTMGQCGREAVVERYGLEEVASMTLAAYRRALGYREAG